ncbi:hypothetical protein V5F82_20450, partial [Xanthobacter flavus]
ALTEFKDALTSGLTKLRSQAAMVPGAGSGQPQGGASGAGQGSGQYAPGGMQPGAGQGGGGPRPGAVVNGFVYKGGNPKDPNSWGRAQ